MAHVPQAPQTPAINPLGNQAWRHIVSQENVPESFVNGFWYQLLRHHFPFPEFIICPEAHVARAAGGGETLRADLLVLQVRPGRTDGYQTRVILAFEGKKGSRTERAFLSHTPQLSNYTSSCTPLVGRKFGALASGPRFLIMAWTQASRHDDIRQITQQEGRIPESLDRIMVQDVNIQDQREGLDRILHYIHTQATTAASRQDRNGWSAATWPL